MEDRWLNLYFSGSNWSFLLRYYCYVYHYYNWSLLNWLHYKTKKALTSKCLISKPHPALHPTAARKLRLKLFNICWAHTEETGSVNTWVLFTGQVCYNCLLFLHLPTDVSSSFVANQWAKEMLNGNPCCFVAFYISKRKQFISQAQHNI